MTTFITSFCFFSCQVDTHGQPGRLGAGHGRPAGGVGLLVGWGTPEQQAERRGRGRCAAHFLAGAALSGECWRKKHTDNAHLIRLYCGCEGEIKNITETLKKWIQEGWRPKFACKQWLEGINLIDWRLCLTPAADRNNYNKKWHMSIEFHPVKL